MATVLAVVSGKGGTGKTSFTGIVGSCLAALGYSTLCVDMDVGLRNLDLSLGLGDRALMDFTDVMQGRCPLRKATVEHPDIRGLHILTAPMSLPPGLTQNAMRDFLQQAATQFEYILLDSPAGLGEGFQRTVCGCNRAVVVSTSDNSALRDAQRTVCQLNSIVQNIHLVVNRVQPRLLRRLHATIDDAMDAAGLPLLGVIPEDEHVLLAANRGRPLILSSNGGAALACLNIARRIRGERVPLMRIR